MSGTDFQTICIPNTNFVTTIADLNSSTRTMRARALEIIGPHEIEVSEGVSIFIKGRKIKRLIAIEERMVRYPSNFDLLE